MKNEIMFGILFAAIVAVAAGFFATGLDHIIPNADAQKFNKAPPPSGQTGQQGGGGGQPGGQGPPPGPQRGG